jgi:hypothetical protein
MDISFLHKMTTLEAIMKAAGTVVGDTGVFSNSADTRLRTG